MSSNLSSEVIPGERIGRYTVVRRLASGGMAEVYLARHEGPKGFSKLVVIKRVLPGLLQTEKFVAMFLDEGRLAARLSHPSIVQAFELGEQDGCFHIVMEYVQGESLTRLVKRAALDGTPIPAGAMLRVVMQVLEALDYAHDLKGDHGDWLKVVHRDVSPTNVIITYHGSVKLLDFGIASSATHEHHTQIGTVKGKGGYMAPEQALALPVDRRTDIYAAGALLYLLATGAGPFEGQEDVFAMMRAAIEGRFPKPSARKGNIAPLLELIILKAMAQKPEDRYPSAAAMLAELEEYVVSLRLFPSARELTMTMRQLFPERAELARSYDQAPDAAVIAKLAESFAEVESSELLSEPTKPARRLGSKADEVAPKSGRPTVKLTGDKEEKTPLYAAPLREHTRTAPLAPSLIATTQVPSMQVALPGYAGAVPELSSHASERATQESRVPAFSPDDSEEKTTGAAFAAARPAPNPARTVSAELELTGPSLEQSDDPNTESGTVTALPPVARTRSLTDMFVGNLVANNAVAFVAAGLVAVLLGVAVLWALSSGD